MRHADQNMPSAEDNASRIVAIVGRWRLVFSTEATVVAVRHG